MKKQLYFVCSAFLIMLLISCAGMPEGSDSIDNLSMLFNPNFKSVEMVRIDQGAGAGLISEWKAENQNANSYSVIRFDENGNFGENVYSNLNGELMASYSGTYKESSGFIEITTGSMDVHVFSFILNANHLHLSAK